MYKSPEWMKTKPTMILEEKVWFSFPTKLYDGLTAFTFYFQTNFFLHLTFCFSNRLSWKHLSGNRPDSSHSLVYSWQKATASQLGCVLSSPLESFSWLHHILHLLESLQLCSIVSLFNLTPWGRHWWTRIEVSLQLEGMFE